MVAIDAIAREFTAMLRAGRFTAAGDAYWAEAVTSVEPADLANGTPASISGIAAARAKAEARFVEHAIVELGIDGPFVTGNQFALFLDMLIADPAGGVAQPFTEIAVFTVRNGRIVEERFFYD